MDFFSSTKVDNIKKFCYDKGELDELKDFYPSDEIIREYGDALMKYSEDTFIYPYSEEKEKK